MNLAEVRSTFRARLNRGDSTPELEDNFLSLGMTRIQRELRVPAMERVQFMDAAKEPIEMTTVPADYLELIEIQVQGERGPRVRVPYRGLRDAREPCYARFGNNFYLQPCVPKGRRVEVLYYGEFTPLTSELDSNEITSMAPDLLVYAALTMAADHFTHDKIGEWEARFTSLLATVQAQANQDEWSGGGYAIQSAYPGA